MPEKAVFTPKGLLLEPEEYGALCKKLVDAGIEEILKDHVSKKIGAIARPSRIIFTIDVPKTRSGKIMRRLLRDVAEGRSRGDVTTLADPGVLKTLKEKYDEV